MESLQWFVHFKIIDEDEGDPYTTLLRFKKQNNEWDKKQKMQI